jgi:hypothetical protein
LSGDTKNLVIDDSKVYADLIAKDPIYEGKVKILYTIGTLPIHLDPANPTKTEFTKDELIKIKSHTTNALDSFKLFSFDTYEDYTTYVHALFDP